MRSSTETYHEVAERCSAYEKTCHCNSMTWQIKWLNIIYSLNIVIADK